MAFIQNQELPLPADIFLQTSKEPNYAQKILVKSGEINKDLGRKKASLSTTKTAGKKNKDEIAEYDEEIDIVEKIQTKNWYFRGRRKNIESRSGYLYTERGTHIRLTHKLVFMEM